MTTTSIQTDAILALCSRIQRRALKTKRVNISVEYAAHAEQLRVWARAADHDYMAKAETWPKPLIDRYIDLSDDDAADQLTAALDEMKDLGRKKG